MVKKKTMVAKKKAATKNNNNKANRSVNGAADRCTTGYAVALGNPWDAEPSCIPSIPSLPSETRKFIARGTFSTSSTNTGFGFIILRPVLANNGSIHPISSSNASYSGSTTATSASPGVDPSAFVTPYPDSAFASGFSHNDVKWRPVAYGIRVRYIGKSVDRGGRVVAYRDQNNGSVTTMTFDQIASRQGASLSAVESNKWTSVCYAPSDPEEFQYSNLIRPNHLEEYGLVVAVAAPRETVIDMEYECCMHVEVLGPYAYNVKLHLGDANLAAKASDILVGVQRGMIDNFKQFTQLYSDASPAMKWIAKNVIDSIYNSRQVAQNLIKN
jgi:hypothetical protein